MKYLRGDIGIFTERGGTIGWLANKDGIVVVDTQFPEQSQHLVEEIKKISAHPLDLLINTHHHGDHTAGNPVYKDLAGKILAHENSKKNQERVARERNQEGQVFPNATFQKTHTESVGGESIKLHYFGPGHTDGDALTHFENANIVHMGDLVFNRRFPYIDKSAGADIGNWIKVLDQALSTFDQQTMYIFGHSDNDFDITGTGEDLKAFQNYLERLLVFGQQSITAGKTLEEVKAATTEIPGAPEWKGDGIGRSLEAVYAELGS
jgi:glyoxylase-like metal-dependent hydrolase (beta-lactamase superfamily II)